MSCAQELQYFQFLATEFMQMLGIGILEYMGYGRRRRGSDLTSRVNQAGVWLPNNLNHALDHSCLRRKSKTVEPLLCVERAVM